MSFGHTGKRQRSDIIYVQNTVIAMLCYCNDVRSCKKTLDRPSLENVNSMGLGEVRGEMNIVSKVMAPARECCNTGMKQTNELDNRDIKLI
jgi:hypothetical protein